MKTSKMPSIEKEHTNFLTFAVKEGLVDPDYAEFLIRTDNREEIQRIMAQAEFYENEPSGYLDYLGECHGRPEYVVLE